MRPRDAMMQEKVYLLAAYIAPPELAYTSRTQRTHLRES